MLNALLFDTSNDDAVVVLASAARPIASKTFPAATAGVALVAAAAALLDAAALPLNAVAFFGAALGPGSFTGLRLGLLAAETLAFAAARPVVGFDSLSLYPPPEGYVGTFAVIIDARSGGFYLACGDVSDAAELRYGPPQRLDVAATAHILRTEHVGLIVTPHIDRVAVRLPHYPEILWHQSSPSPLRMASQAHRRFIAGDYPATGLLDALYLKNDDCVPHGAASHKVEIKEA